MYFNIHRHVQDVSSGMIEVNEFFPGTIESLEKNVKKDVPFNKANTWMDNHQGSVTPRH